MAKRIILGVLLACFGAAVGGGELVLPTFAYHLRGKAGNLWTSEIYLANPGAAPVTVELADWVLSFAPPEHPCAAPFIGRHEVPAHGSIIWPAREISQGLGCIEPIVGGLVFASEGEFTLGSRLVNERAGGEVTALELLRGVGQDVPGIERATVAADRAMLLPSLAWHPNSCGPPLFETYLNLVNLGEEPAKLTVALPESDATASLTINGREVTLPATIEVGGRAFLQVLIGPPPSMLPVCLGPTLFDLRATASSSLSVIASVVDRTVNDARTVVPLAVHGGS